MAVAIDASSQSGSSTANPVSWTHTPSGTPAGVIVFIINDATGTDLWTTATYGGVSMTAVSGAFAADTAGEGGNCKAYFLGSGIPTGAQTVSVSRSSGTHVAIGFCATVTASGDTDVYTGGIVLLQEDGTLAEQNVTDNSPGTNSLRFAAGKSGLNTPPTVGANSTSLQSIDFGTDGAVFCRETTAGQGSRPVGYSSGSTDDRAFVHLAVYEILVDTVIPYVGGGYYW